MKQAAFAFDLDDVPAVDEPLSPILKWAGGKRWLLPHLRPLWAPHQHRRLVEPFVGGAAVAFGLRPARALLSDINLHLMGFYRWVQLGLAIEIKLAYDESLYYAHRDRFNRLARAQSPTADGLSRAESAEAASLFYYLNRTCFNGLCRFNRSGEFNVPFGKYATVTYAREWPAHATALSAWSTEWGPFQQVLLAPGDFVYADPPYDVEFTQYAKDGFTWCDQMRLAKWLARHPGPVVASNQATDRIVELYTSLGFALQYLDAPRRIACTGDRTPAREMLATRNLSAVPS